MANCLRILFPGVKFSICAIVVNDRCDVQKEWDKIRKSNKEAAKRLFALFEKVSNEGIENLSPYKFEILSEGCYEFKESEGLRFLAILDTDRNELIVLKNVFRKGNLRTQAAKIKDLEEFRRNYKAEDYPLEENVDGYE